MTFSSIRVTENQSSSRDDRSMSNGRLLGTAFSLFLGMFFVYTSIFYVPAFLNIRGAFGISGAHSLAKAKSSKSPLSPFMNLLNMDRAYLAAGQGVDVHYNLARGTKAELVFYKCQTMPVVEVFSCDPIIVDRIPLGRKRSGQKSLKVKSNGFYAFKIITEAAPGNYQIAWQRRY